MVDLLDIGFIRFLLKSLDMVVWRDLDYTQLITQRDLLDASDSCQDCYEYWIILFLSLMCQNVQCGVFSIWHAASSASISSKWNLAGNIVDELGPFGRVSSISQSYNCRTCSTIYSQECSETIVWIFLPYVYGLDFPSFIPGHWSPWASIVLWVLSLLFISGISRVEKHIEEAAGNYFWPG